MIFSHGFVHYLSLSEVGWQGLGYLAVTTTRYSPMGMEVMVVTGGVLIGAVVNAEIPGTLASACVLAVRLIAWATVTNQPSHHCTKWV